MGKKKWCSVAMGRDELGHITTYDTDELTKFGVCYVITGTFLGEHFVWRQSALLISIQVGIVILCKYAFKGKETLIPADIVTPVATVMNGLVGFLLSMYVSDALARWWTVREKMLGGLVAGIDMINMALSRRHRSGGNYDEWLIEQYGRMSLAVHELIYIQGERDLHAGGDHDIQILVERNFLLEEEARELKGVDNKAMVVWAWCCALVTDYAVLPFDEAEQAVGAFMKGRQAIQGIFTYIDTLLPLAYIHMIMFVVKFSVLLLALQAGLVSAKAYAFNELGKIFVQTFILLFIPGIYQGLLSMENDLRNPFGTDEIDFPRATYRTGAFMRHQEYNASAKSLPFHDKDCMPDAPKPNNIWFNKNHAEKADGDDHELVPRSAVAMHQQRISSLENENHSLRTYLLNLVSRAERGPTSLDRKPRSAPQRVRRSTEEAEW
jgi:hypothetical protein